MSQYKKNIGQAGENYALSFLRQQGYEILSTNFRTRCGEIDIVARENGYLVFIEVKTRTGQKYGGGLAAVSPSKKHHLIKTALIYITRFQLHHENSRFDLFSLHMTPDGMITGHDLIKNAFDVERRYRF